MHAKDRVVMLTSLSKAKQIHKRSFVPWPSDAAFLPSVYLRLTTQKADGRLLVSVN